MGLFDMCCLKKTKKSSLDYIINWIENADKRFEDIDTYLENLNTAINGDNGLDSRVSSLEAALNEKQDTLTFDTTPTANSTNPVTSGGVKTALDEKADKNKIQQMSTNNAYAAVETLADNQGLIVLHLKDDTDMVEDFTYISKSNIQNLKRALQIPDATPTTNSDNLVTSGGVKAALDGKRDLVGQTISLVINGQEIEIESSDVPNLIRALSNPDSTPTSDSDKLVTSGGVNSALSYKADKASSVTAGNLAALDANGNLIDGGAKSQFAPASGSTKNLLEIDTDSNGTSLYIARIGGHMLEDRSDIHDCGTLMGEILSRISTAEDYALCKVGREEGGPVLGLITATSTTQSSVRTWYICITVGTYDLRIEMKEDLNSQSPGEEYYAAQSGSGDFELSVQNYEF